MSNKDVLKSQNEKIEEALELDDDQLVKAAGGIGIFVDEWEMELKMQRTALLRDSHSKEEYEKEKAELAATGMYSERELSIIFEGLC